MLHHDAKSFSIDLHCEIINSGDNLTTWLVITIIKLSFIFDGSYMTTEQCPLHYITPLFNVIRYQCQARHTQRTLS